MPDTQPSNASFHEIEVSRVVLREPTTGRVGATLEFNSSAATTEKEGVSLPRFILYDASNRPALAIEIQAAGEARITVGHPDHGPMVTLARDSVSVWADGNEVVGIDSADGGRVQLTDAEGRIVLTLPGTSTRA